MNTSIAPAINKTSAQRFPLFPSLLAKPVSLLPQKLHTAAIVKMLNTVLEIPLQEGDLDFLEGQSVSVEITDLKLRFALTLEQGNSPERENSLEQANNPEQEKLARSVWVENDDLNLRGNLYDFLLLASRTEDSDTLFFQRRLKMTGSTDLGLEVKNLLDGLEMESVRFHKPIDFALKRAVRLYERIF